MKMTDLKTHSSKFQPSELLEAYMASYTNGESLAEFVTRFDYDSLDELRHAIVWLYQRIVNDAYLNPDNRKNNNDCAVVYARARGVLNSQARTDMVADEVSTRLWRQHYSRKVLDKRTSALLDCEPDAAEYNAAVADIQQLYHLSDCDVAKIAFFTAQVRAGQAFPNSLRRMLYIWGGAKKTGKTTTADTLCAILNGLPNCQKAAQFNTSLAQELQFGNFAVPKISEFNVCVMDECFYADMGKVYADFKRFMTSANGMARLPYGQPFEWFGLPNYIATSNDPLVRFIKDWNDRRFLSIEFKQKPTQQLSFADIYALWLRFIRNAPVITDWYAAANAIADIADERGERQVFSNEFELELRQPTFIHMLTSEVAASSKTCNANRRPLKYFVDYFAQRDNGVRKQRTEIEQAVKAVFGEPTYNGVWLLTDLQAVANQMMYNDDDDDVNTQLPF